MAATILSIEQEIFNMWWGHSKRQCVTALVGVKQLLDRISYMDDKQVRQHTCESAKEIIDNLLREKDKDK